MTDPTEPTESIKSPDTSEPIASSDPVAAEPAANRPSRWERLRPTGRLGQVTAILVATAAGVFIAGSIFVAGLVVGAEGGADHHHGHGGDEYSHDDGGGDHHRGDASEGAGSRNGDGPGRDDDGPGHG